MFQSARLKLTAWYLAIIMTVSISFSLFIYKMVTFEFERRLAAIESRLELGKLGVPTPSIGQIHYFIQDIVEARRRVFVILFNTNVIIFVVSALGGYFLAGKTLRPIEKALDDQKRFVADASHELKTPLTALQTSIEVTLRDKSLNLKEAKHVLKDSLKDVDDLKRLTTDLLVLAKVGNQNGKVHEKTEVDKVLLEALKKIKPIASKNNVTINHSLESFKAVINKSDIEKLVGILLDNAVKYSGKGSKVWLTLKKSKSNFEISVKDEGVGIPENSLPHIFERFYRTDISRTKNYVPGFGLGLSIAKKIVDEAGGTIDVKSELGKGSIFIAKVPLH